MKFELPKIYPITDRALSGLSHLEQVRRLIDGGAQLIQLRDKTADARSFFADAVEVIDYAHASGAKIILNDRVDVALAARADGVHLGQNDLPPEEARTILGPEAIIGFSTHSIRDAELALGLPIDYVALGPIFATSTKNDPDPVVGNAALSEAALRKAGFPLVAIGGITLANARSVLDAGADSLAIISALLTEADAITSRMQGFNAI